MNKKKISKDLPVLLTDGDEIGLVWKENAHSGEITIDFGLKFVLYDTDSAPYIESELLERVKTSHDHSPKSSNIGSPKENSPMQDTLSNFGDLKRKAEDEPDAPISQKKLNSGKKAERILKVQE